jgi:hypothetical protein
MPTHNGPGDPYANAPPPPPSDDASDEMAPQTSGADKGKNGKEHSHADA